MRTVVTLLCLTAGAAGVVSCSVVTPELLASGLLTVAQPPPKVASLIDGYQGWNKVNSVPYKVKAPPPEQCFVPMSWLAHGHLAQKGVFADGFAITVYVNPVGAKAMTAIKPDFPKGSIIVKEKRPLAKGSEPELLTVMVKRAPGFDKQTGDWEYLGYTGNGIPIAKAAEKGRCAGCHASEKAKDYVFRTYLPTLKSNGR
jgi:hypothetical protein